MFAFAIVIDFVFYLLGCMVLMILVLQSKMLCTIYAVKCIWAFKYAFHIGLYCSLELLVLISSR